MSRSMRRLGLTLRFTFEELQAIKNMTPKGVDQKKFAKYCLLSGLNEVVERAKKRYIEQQEKEKANVAKTESESVAAPDNKVTLQDSAESIT